MSKSAPYMSQLSTGGVGGQLSPSPGPQPGPRGMPGIGGVSLAGVNFLPGVVPKVRLNARGQPVPSSSVNTEMPSNSFVSVPYVLNKLNNGSENTLIAGMLIFGERRETEMKLGVGTTVPTHTVIHIGELNSICYKAWQAIKAAERDNRGGEEARFLQALRDVPEDKLAHYACLRSNAACRKLVEEMEKGDNGKKLQFLYEKCMEKKSNYALIACPQMIMDRFCFLGVVKNRSDSETLDTMRTRTAALVLNTVHSHLTEIHDVFVPTREMHVDSHLFLHYGRRACAPRSSAAGEAGADDAFGPFVITPMCSYQQGRPSVQGSYRDMSGVLRAGLLQEIGTVRHMKNREDSEITQRVASGIDPSLEMVQVMRSTVRLATIEANLMVL